MPPCGRGSRPPTRSTPGSRFPRSPGPRTCSRSPASSGGARASTFPVPWRASASARAAAEELEAELAATGFTPIPVEDRELASFLEREGRLVRLGDGLALGTAAYEEAKRLMVEECEQRGLHHPCALPRPARDRTQAGPAPPRALRRGRPHEARRRRARAAAPGQDRLSYVSRGAAWAWWPSRSSKPVRRGSPTLGRFDSCAAPLKEKSSSHGLFISVSSRSFTWRATGSRLCTGTCTGPSHEPFLGKLGLSRDSGPAGRRRTNP